MLSRPDGQKLLCRGKCLYLQPRGAEQTTQAFPDRRFVVNYTNKRVVLIHGFTSQESETRSERNSIGPWSDRDWTLVLDLGPTALRRTAEDSQFLSRPNKVS